MRTLKLQVQTTVDGYMGGPNGEMDWMHFPWSDDLAAYIAALSDPVDTIVLGRKLAEGFIPAWKSGPPGETQAAIDFMNNTPRVVVSQSLTESPWENATIVPDTDAIAELKQQAGGDIIVYGGSTLVSDLIAKGLIDELHLIVNPTAIGAGLPIFARGDYAKLQLAKATPFECGIIAMHWQPRRG